MIMIADKGIYAGIDNDHYIDGISPILPCIDPFNDVRKWPKNKIGPDCKQSSVSRVSMSDIDVTSRAYKLYMDHRQYTSSVRLVQDSIIAAAKRNGIVARKNFNDDSVTMFMKPHNCVVTINGKIQKECNNNVPTININTEDLDSIEEIIKSFVSSKS